MYRLQLDGGGLDVIINATNLYHRLLCGKVSAIPAALKTVGKRIDFSEEAELFGPVKSALFPEIQLSESYDIYDPRVGALVKMAYDVHAIISNSLERLRSNTPKKVSFQPASIEKVADFTTLFTVDDSCYQLDVGERLFLVIAKSLYVYELTVGGSFDLLMLEIALGGTKRIDTPALKKSLNAVKIAYFDDVEPKHKNVRIAREIRELIEEQHPDLMRFRKTG